MVFTPHLDVLPFVLMFFCLIVLMFFCLIVLMFFCLKSFVLLSKILFCLGFVWGNS